MGAPLPPGELPPPVELLEVRTGKMAPLGPVMSGIDKQRRQQSLYVSALGLPDDEHDPIFHGGVDKAIHAYDLDHYAEWQMMFPDEHIRSRFTPGGFGENLVARGLSEDNICIGDLVQIAYPEPEQDRNKRGCNLEVSLPRQPCFKLNQRFGIKNFAPMTHQLARTGWYYRVKQSGHIQAGMHMKVVERRNPAWSITRVHRYVHREKDFRPEMQELIDMKELGDECRLVFVEKLKKHQSRIAASLTPKTEWQRYELVHKAYETPRILRLIFEATNKVAEPRKVSPGSHALIRLPNQLRRAYSIVEGSSNSFTLGVALDDRSRGGSKYIHEALNLHDTIEVGDFSQSMERASMASHHIFIVGGIGITAFLAMMARITAINQTFELHNCVRTAHDISFSLELTQYGVQVKTYIKDQGQRLDIPGLLRGRPWNSHVYVCGPQRMINAVLDAASQQGIPEDEIHFEQFQADTGGDPFTVDVETLEGRQYLQVTEYQTLLDALVDAGFDVPSSCQAGNCGSCRLPLLKGKVDHRGAALSANEKDKEILSCVSRGVGHIVIGLPEA